MAVVAHGFAFDGAAPRNGLQMTLEMAAAWAYKQVTAKLLKGSRVRKLLVVASVVGVLGTAGIAVADPNLTLQSQPHRHFLQTPSGPVEIGPRYCDDKDNLALKSAFTQFHANVHTHSGVTGEIGPVAPGLQNPSPAPHITVVFC